MKSTQQTAAQVELRRIMARDQLSYQDVANLICGGKAERVKAWLKPTSSTSHRSIRANDLRLLDLVGGTRIATSLEGAVRFTCGTATKIKTIAHFSLAGISAAISMEKDIATRLANGETLRIGGAIVSPGWALIQVSGPLGKCYLAIGASVHKMRDGSIEFICQTLEQARDWKMRKEDMMDAAKETRLRELLQQEQMYEAQHAEAIAKGNYREASKINSALKAMGLLWSAQP